MKETNGTNHKEKSVLTANQNTFDINLFDSLDGDSNGSSAFNYAEYANKLQRQICNPNKQQIEFSEDMTTFFSAA
jgi:hypothetical protein